MEKVLVPPEIDNNVEGDLGYRHTDHQLAFDMVEHKRSSKLQVQ
jgi:hypothetical protein